MELKLNNLSAKQIERLNAYRLLAKKQYFNSAIQICWSILREEIFNACTKEDCKYKSTDEAIFKFISSSQNMGVNKSIQELYIVSTIAEYDSSFNLSKEVFLKIEKSIKNILKQSNVGKTTSR